MRMEITFDVKQKQRGIPVIPRIEVMATVIISDTGIPSACVSGKQSVTFST
jgi:hypothetical protein